MDDAQGHDIYQLFLLLLPKCIGMAGRMSSRVELYEDNLGEHQNSGGAVGDNAGEKLAISFHANDFIDVARSGLC